MPLLHQESSQDQEQNARGNRSGRAQPSGRVPRGELFPSRNFRRQKFKRDPFSRQTTGRQAERGGNSGVGRYGLAKFVGGLRGESVHADAAAFKARPDFVNQTLDLLLWAEDVNSPDRRANFFG